MNLNEYFENARRLDRLDNIADVRFGLVGEVGGILTIAKKRNLEEKNFDFMTAMVEELGDVIWYFFRLADRLEIKLDELVPKEFKRGKSRAIITTNISGSPIAHMPSMKAEKLSKLLPKLAEGAIKLLDCKSNKSKKYKDLLRDFFCVYLKVLQAAGVGFSDVLKTNRDKSEGRFIIPDFYKLPNYDAKFKDDDERLPDQFIIEIIERSNGKIYLKWNGVFIGDPLTDNIESEDGYRFHDVLHMAHAAILHWSPTFRSLIRHKRKSDPKYDEIQDGGRAIVIEEGLTAWIFSRAKQVEMFKGKDRIPYDILKTVKQFVVGYEVETCPMSLWEKAIIEGYKIFRKIKVKKKGFIIGNRIHRTISYRENLNGFK